MSSGKLSAKRWPSMALQRMLTILVRINMMDTYAGVHTQRTPSNTCITTSGSLESAASTRMASCSEVQSTVVISPGRCGSNSHSSAPHA